MATTTAVPAAGRRAGAPSPRPGPARATAAVRVARGVLWPRRAWAPVAYTALAVPVGVLALGALLPVLMPPYALVLWMLSRSVQADTVLSLLVPGLVLLAPGLGLARLLGALERRLAGRLLGLRPVGPAGRRWWRVALEEASWRELLWLLLRVVVATLVIAYWVLVVGVMSETLGGRSGAREASLLLVPLALLVAVHAGRGLAWAQSRALVPLLGDVAAARLAEEQERSRGLEDRARLARELHDSVGHGVTLMVLQAGAARATPGDDGREALAAVERSGRAVMADLHRVLGLLDPSVPHRGAEAGDAPWSGVEGALQAAGAAGVDVHRVVRDGPARVTADVEALVTRCLREALTNAATHAPGSRVVVDLRTETAPAEPASHGADGVAGVDGSAPRTAPTGRPWIVLRVHDDGARLGTVAPVLPSHRGSGLAGLTTDAVALGGRLDAGPVDGGFAVDLRLPLGHAG